MLAGGGELLSHGPVRATADPRVSLHRTLHQDLAIYKLEVRPVLLPPRTRQPDPPAGHLITGPAWVSCKACTLELGAATTSFSPLNRIALYINLTAFS